MTEIERLSEDDQWDQYQKYLRLARKYTELANASLPVAEERRVEPLSLGEATVSITETYLELRPDLTYEEWERSGATLGTLSRGVQFWVGDWVNFGERHFANGEKYLQALSVTGLSPQTLMNWAWVSSKVEPAMRRPDLSWSHHLAVAALEPASQEALLDNAVAGKWSSRELKEQVKGSPSSRWEEEWCGKCGKMVKVRCDE